MKIEEVMQNTKKIFDELTTRTSTIYKQIKSLHTHSNALQNKIEAFESRNENYSSSNYLPEFELCNESFDGCKISCDECTYAELNKKIQLLELQLKSKNEIIAMLELQIYTTHLFDEKFYNLYDRLLMEYHIKISELEVVIEGLRTTRCIRLGVQEDEMIHEIEEGELDLEECNSISPKKEIKRYRKLEISCCFL